jgi:hypothetical protein
MNEHSFHRGTHACRFVVLAVVAASASAAPGFAHEPPDPMAATVAQSFTLIERSFLGLHERARTAGESAGVVTLRRRRAAVHALGAGPDFSVRRTRRTRHRTRFPSVGSFAIPTDGPQNP